LTVKDLAPRRPPDGTNQSGCFSLDGQPPSEASRA
jgi:hypothetical protein